jgi:hypothetical protein
MHWHATFFHVMQAFHNLNAHEATLVFTSTSTHLLAFSFHLVEYLSWAKIKLQLVGLHMNGKAHKPLCFLFQLCRFLFRLYLIARFVPLACRSYRERKFNPDRQVCFQKKSGSDIYIRNMHFASPLSSKLDSSFSIYCCFGHLP